MRVLLVAWLLASNLSPRPFAERALQADRVVVVQVVAQRLELVGGDAHRMLTHTNVLVGETLKGPQGLAFERLTITQLGGKSGPWEAHVPGDASFQVGETALVLLKCSRRPDQCGLVGLNEGKATFVGSDAFVFSLKSNAYARRPVTDLLAEVKATLVTSGGVAPAPAAATASGVKK